MADGYAPHLDREHESLQRAARAPEADPGATGHAGPLVARMMDLQRTAGNRAVVQRLQAGGLLAPVQRVVEIDEVSSEVGAAGGATPAADGSAGGTEINDTSVRVNAGTIDLNAAIVRVSGIVQADTVVADSVVASSYTPGAGNAF